MKPIHLLVALAGLALALPLAATSAKGFPERIDIPNGWQPEGIATGKHDSFYSGSRATGAVYKGNLKTGEGAAAVASFVECQGGLG